ncbi:MAG: hypothetical protein ACLGHF_08510 [Alphaproteobacteria bacterium]
MGFELHSAFERHEEWRSAKLCELEYAEMARTLKALATEQGIDVGPVIAGLAGKGLGEALGVLAQLAGNDLEAGYYRCRARLRQSGQ